MSNRFRNTKPPVFEEETELLSTLEQSKVAQPSANDEPVANSKKGKSWGRKLLGGELLTSRQALRQSPLILLIVVCAILMVSNRYTVEKLRKEVISTRKRIDELSLEQIQMKSRYQQSIKISSIAQTLDTIGIHLITEPPFTLQDKR